MLVMISSLRSSSLQREKLHALLLRRLTSLLSSQSLAISYSSQTKSQKPMSNKKTTKAQWARMSFQRRSQCFKTSQYLLTLTQVTSCRLHAILCQGPIHMVSISWRRERSLTDTLLYRVAKQKSWRLELAREISLTIDRQQEGNQSKVLESRTKSLQIFSQRHQSSTKPTRPEKLIKTPELESMSKESRSETR